VHARRPVVLSLLIALVVGLVSVPATTHAVSQLGRLKDEGAATFGSPWGLATDDLGDIYVTDPAKHRITKFDGFTREPEWVVGSNGSGDSQLYTPQGLAVGDGVVYVADTLNHRIAMFTPEGAWAGSIVGRDEEAFAYPADVDYANGYIFVVEGGGRCRVQMIRKSGSSYNVVDSFGGCGSGPTQFSSPIAVAATDTEIFVVDAQLNVVKKFDYLGKHLLTIGSPGGEAGQFDGPYAIAATKTETEGTHIWVIESGMTSRAQRFTGDGTLVDSLSGTNGGHFTFPHGIALSPTADQLYIADSGADDPNVYAFLETEPEMSLRGDGALKRLVKTEGIWFRMSYNQTTKTCRVLAKATVTVPGHPAFAVEDEFKIRSMADDYRIHVSNKQAKWMKQAEAGNKKVSISGSAAGKCSDNARVTAKDAYKAG
jgi:DNA-binding beta-propeller fold protein YncE